MRNNPFRNACDLIESLRINCQEPPLDGHKHAFFSGFSDSQLDPKAIYAWALEFESHVLMDLPNAEHIREALYEHMTENRAILAKKAA